MRVLTIAEAQSLEGLVRWAVASGLGDVICLAYPKEVLRCTTATDGWQGSTGYVDMGFAYLLQARVRYLSTGTHSTYSGPTGFSRPTTGTGPTISGWRQHGVGLGARMRCAPKGMATFLRFFCLRGGVDLR